MNTNSIKSFAKEARLLLLDGVLQRLKYWGFNEEGSNDQELQSTQGGYIFRGQIYTDTSVPVKWKTLKTRLKDKQAVLDVIEEASYTWFNRLMAIKILEENGYLPTTLAFAEGVRTPMIVQNAKKGMHNLSSQADKNLLLEFLQEDKEEQAFGLLISDLCNRNKLLHDIFGRIDDYTEILLPQNLLQKDGMLDLINSDAIAEDDYKEVELIGWLYQFYISDKKDEVFAGFKKNKKARAEDIPAATQIFTPKWIVKYMVENTVGKIYLDYEPNSSLRDDMRYLVDPASRDQGQGTRDEQDTALIPNPTSLITDITELTLIDPASGSGHILVTGFELLFKMYREEGYTAKQAVDNILEHNLFGLDIDDRAMQLARFAVLLKAAQFDTDVLNRGIIPHVYSFPEASHFTSEELQNFLGHDGHQFTAELKEALQLLNQGKNLGSALKLELSEEAQNHIKKQYQDWLQLSKRTGLDIEQSSIWNRLHPFLDVLLVLTKKYASVVANPPYMGDKGMNNALKLYLLSNYDSTYYDLATVFMEVCLDLLKPNARYSMINQASWMLKPSFKTFRENLILNSLKSSNFDSLIYLGPGVFEELKGEVVQSVCFTVVNSNIKLSYLYKANGIKGSNQKEEAFVSKMIKPFKKFLTDFEEFEGKQFGFWLNEILLKSFSESPIKYYGDAKQGIKTGDNSRFIKYWHELSRKKFNNKWFPVEKGGEFKKWFGNNYYLLNWENDGYEIKNFKNEKGKLRSRPQNLGSFFTEGLTWSTSAGSRPSFRFSTDCFTFESSGSKFFITNQKQNYNLKHFIGFLNSEVTRYIVEVFAPGIGFSEGSIKALPFLEISDDYLNKTERLSEKNITISKKDWDSRETSWDFEKPLLLNEAGSLAQAYQKWQEQVSDDFFQLHANEEELNRIFIDIYGLQEELTPEVALKDITILQEELAPRNQKKKKGQTEDVVNKTWVHVEEAFRTKGKEHTKLPFLKDKVIGQFISYSIGVFLGRYRLDKPGLNIAYPNPTEEELSKYKYKGHGIEIDEDGILPLMGEDCAFPDDALVRTKDLVHAVWGEDSLTENINFIHDALGMDLHKWLTEKFWGYHTSMYKKKPIYWLFSSNVKKPQNAAFKVLVYMHRMDKYTVQKIQRNYLHPHQEYIKREIEKLSDNEENLSKQEMKRLEQLRNHELECRDYNEVLKELANQQIEFDLDDGVSVNYEKFEGAVAKI